MTAATDNRALVRAFIEEFWNQRNYAWADQGMSPDFFRREIGSGTEYHGIAGIKEAARKWGGAFPDAHLTIDDLIIEGDAGALRWTGVCTHLGEFEGLPPTGRKVTLRGISTFRFAGGRITEELVSLDALGLMQQLGVSPV
jgi:steroid delta-isomerase-like uncharacterized protein